jgi:hypothetical protein
MSSVKKGVERQRRGLGAVEGDGEHVRAGLADRDRLEGDRRARRIGRSECGQEVGEIEPGHRTEVALEDEIVAVDREAQARRVGGQAERQGIEALGKGRKHGQRGADGEHTCRHAFLRTTVASPP